MSKTNTKTERVGLKRVANTVLWPVLTTLLGLVIGGLIILASGENPFQVYGTMFNKSFKNTYYLFQTLLRSSPIIICALAAAFSWRAGYINLGVEGQMICGGLAGVVIGLFMPGPGWLVILTAFLGSCAAGALYALLPTFTQHKCGVSMIISTLMLNYVARYIADYFVGYPLKDTSGSVESMQTPMLDESVRLLRLSKDSNFNIGFILTILVVFLVLFIMNRTVFGYESKMGGLNPNFARYGGVRQNRVMYLTMAFSGALGGFAGFIEVFGAKYRFISSMFSSASYAWTGLMASLVGQYNPIASTVYSIFFAGLDVGGQSLQRDFGLPLQISDIIKCTIMLFVSVQFGIHIAKKRNKKKGQEVKG